MADTRFPAKFQPFKVQDVGLMIEPTLFLSGAFGGPLIIGSLTPLRNACTLAAQDTVSTAGQLYGRVFSKGLLSGWTGATTPAAAAAVQFTTLGPGYYAFLKLLGSPAAAVTAGVVTETLITYGPTTRNAQLMHNEVSSTSAKVTVKPIRPFGPGFGALVLRNCCANAGIRVLSTPFADMLSHFSMNQAPAGVCRFGGDFLASVVCGAISMPFNQLYNFQVTSEASQNANAVERFKMGLSFLKKQYLAPSDRGTLRLSKVVLRDAGLRSLYIGCMFSSYAAVERLFLSFAQQT